MILSSVDHPSHQAAHQSVRQPLGPDYAGGSSRADRVPVAARVPSAEVHFTGEEGLREQQEGVWRRERKRRDGGRR